MPKEQSYHQNKKASGLAISERPPKAKNQIAPNNGKNAWDKDIRID